MSMVENARIARKLGYLDIPDENIVTLAEALKMKSSKVVLMCTGTQGEPSSILGRLSTGTNRQFSLEKDDTVVLSSHPIPGNEEMVYRTINRLLQRGAEVIYEPIEPVHVSGHASQEEMKLMIQLVRPKYLIPVHGELRHLHQHRKLAIEVGMEPDNIAIVENGMIIELKDEKLSIKDRIPGGYVFVDGSGVGDVGPAVMREREALARDGFVVVHLKVNRINGKLVGKPEIVSKGFVFVRDAEELFQHAQSKIEKCAANGNGRDLENEIEKDLSQFFYTETRRRPMVFVFTSEVG
jgi:ribonuclease J